MTKIPGIIITIGGKPIKNLVATTIKFINSGNQTLYPDDFARFEPLSATVKGQFLNIEHGYQVSSDNPNSCPNINFIDNKTANIEFDFLKPKQSFTITLWHNGNLSVLGELKAGKIRDYRGFHVSLIDLLLALISLHLVVVTFVLAKIFSL